MDIYDLTVKQLKRAAAIKDQLARLNKKLRSIVGVPVKSKVPIKKIRTMSEAVRKKIAATQRARWAKLRRAKPVTRSVNAVSKAKKKVFSAATRAKLSAKLKAYWAAKKKADKK